MSFSKADIPFRIRHGAPWHSSAYTLCWVLAWFGCSSDVSSIRFDPVPVSHSGIDFRNDLSESKALNILRYIYYYNGAGVGVADFDRDGLEDVFFAANEHSCRLYRNLGALRFEDRTVSAGLTTHAWCTGVAVADVDADGWPDIYVCVAGHPVGTDRRNLLFLNRTALTGRLSFVEAAAEWGLADTSYSTHAAFLDFDRDGDLDLYLLNHANERDALNTPTPLADRLLADSRDRLYKNDGVRFREVSDSMGVNHTGNGLGIAVSDFNRDGWPDIFVANDFIAGDRLYLNVAGRHFKEIADQAFRRQSYNSMGCDAADVNNDLLTDLFVADMLPDTEAGRKRMAGSMTLEKWHAMTDAGFPAQVMRNVLQLAVPLPDAIASPAFFEVARQAGLAATDWSWAPLFSDLDNDGTKDLFLTTGYPRDIVDRDYLDYSNQRTLFLRDATADSVMLDLLRQRPGRMVPNRFFKNFGHGDFRPMPQAWEADDIPPCSNGAAWADLDLDGDLDLIVNHINAPATILENTGTGKGHHIRIRLVGPSDNPDGVGARVLLHTAGNRQLAEQWPQRGFLSSVSPFLHIGIGPSEQVDSLRIIWPDGREQLLVDTPADQELALDHRNASPVDYTTPAGKPNRTFFRELAAADWGLPAEAPAGANYVHCLFPPLSLQRCETARPLLLAADINKDERSELFLADGAGNPPVIFTLAPEGNRFIRQALPWRKDDYVTAACLLDVDADGWLDLALASHGPDRSAATLTIRTNDGQGNFLPAAGFEIPMPGPISVLCPADYDRDGDADLFAAGGPLYDQYPLAAKSFLLENTGAGFRIVPQEASPGFGDAGIVRAAAWTDLDGDGWEDLLTLGEWNSPRMWLNSQGILREQTRQAGLSNFPGWWQTLRVADLDGDGDQDFLAGNIGINTTYTRPGIESLRLYGIPLPGKDQWDIVPAFRSEGAEWPVHGRNELLRHLAGLDRKFPSHAAFSAASMAQVLGKDRMSSAKVWEMAWFQSTLFRNDGTGRFSAEPLPPAVQSAPVFALLPVSRPEGPGILVAGNTSGFDVPEPSADALPGLMLTRESSRTYRCRWPVETGIFLSDEVRALATVQRGGHHAPLVLAVRADGHFQVFETISDESGLLR
ncbi:MAG: hypothetical protein RLY31_1135 [Bacteroidota bacterium]